MTLESLALPTEIAVVHVPGHQKGSSPEAVGNRRADEEAKRAATEKPVQLLTLIPLREGLTKLPVFTQMEVDKMNQLGAHQDTEGRWRIPDGRQLLNKEVTRSILQRLHQQTHWGVQAMCDTILREYACRGIYTLAQQEVVGCPTCQKINKKVMRSTPRGGQPMAM